MAICKCGEIFPDARKKLGYRTCLECGSPPINPVIIPVNKSNYIVGRLSDLKDNNHKGTRTW